MLRFPLNRINFSGLNGANSTDLGKDKPKALFGSELATTLNDRLSRQFREQPMFDYIVDNGLYSKQGQEAFGQTIDARFIAASDVASA
ncbi:hypothetical protein ACM43_01095 [Bradyrhizobium sp. CCBAU 45321]|nr:hypothetical protein [Bradyrhizobium sp. CCBAU 45321]